MEIGWRLDFKFYPGQGSFGEIKQCVKHALHIIGRALRLSLMRPAAHEAESSHDLPLLLLRDASPNRQGQSKVEKVNYFIFLSLPDSQVVRLDVSMQIAYLMHGLQSINNLETNHDNTFNRKGLLLKFVLEIIQVTPNELHQQVSVLHEIASLVVLPSSLKYLDEASGEVLLLNKPVHFLLNICVFPCLLGNQFDGVMILLVFQISSQVHVAETSRLQFLSNSPAVVDRLLD